MEFDRSEINRFLTDPVFVELARKGNQDLRWKEYELAHWQEREAMAQARMVLLASDRFPGQNLEEGGKKALWNRIEQELSVQEGKPQGFRGVRKLWRWSAAAAIVAVMGGIAWLNRPAEDSAPEAASYLTQDQSENGFLEKVNTRESVFPVDLPDGSTVLLSQDSRVLYSPRSFGKEGRREVYLYGEAFFEVVANPEAPFYVYANDLTTKVLGTSFSVRAFPEDKEVEVIVKTGRVTVFASGPGDEARQGPEPEGEIVNPDERIVLDRASRLFSLGKTDYAETEVENLVFMFDDKPVADVFEALQSYYKIRILVPADLLKDCKITATLTDETLYEKIRLICKGLNATYQVVDGEIVITSDGCE